MALSHSPSLVTSGLTFYYDVNNLKKSFKGVPTTNVSAGIGLNIYNNVPSDVSATLVQTSETYDGAPVWKLTLTPITATGVGYLTNGNNPGIGVYTSNGGGSANIYTGHAMYYKPTVTMHSTPLFTNYSNIPGYGAGSLGSNRSVDMGDGWYRGEVIWYDTVTRSDGKFWAINPASATLNAPMVFYWAGPFREDRNDSTMVGQYVNGTRSNTGALLDMIGNYTLTTNSLTYLVNNTFIFPGTTSGNIDLNTQSLISGVNPFTIESWTNKTSGSYGAILTNYGSGYTTGLWWSTAGLYIQGSVYHADYANSMAGIHYSAVTRDGSGNVVLYRDGVQVNTGVLASSIPSNINWRIGGDVNGGGEALSGYIYNLKTYNRVLTAYEITQNFNALRSKYGL